MPQTDATGITRVIFTAITLGAWILALSALTDPHWPNNQAIEAGRAEKALQKMIDGTD